MDYKEILRNKVSRLQALLEKCSQNLSPDELAGINILIENTYNITDGRLDALDYDVRDRGIMEYHSKLDNAFSKFKQFDEREQDKQTEREEI